MTAIETVQLFEQKVMACSTKEEARVLAQDFMLSVAETKPPKQLMFMLAVKYRYLLRWFNLLKEK